MKKIKIIVLFILALAFCLFALTVVINLPVFDEKLRPEVQAIKDIKAVPFAEANAFIDILSLGGDETDLFESSKKIRELLNQKIINTGLDYFDENEYSRYIRQDLDTEWQQIYRTCNSRSDKKCASEVIQSVVNKPISDARLLTQLNKYRQLLSKNNYKESTNMDFTVPFPAFGPVMNLKRLYLANAYLNDDVESFFQIANQDYQFWRMVFENSHWLITRMVANASIRGSIQFLSLAIQEERLDSEQLWNLQELLEPLTPGKTNMAKVFDFEFKYGLDFYEVAEKRGEFNTQKVFDFFQLNATHNLAFELTTKTLRKMAAMNSHEFYQYLNSEPAHILDKYEFKWRPSSLYNPTGKLLVNYSQPAYQDYIGRIHDLNGMIHLLKLQIELALNADRPKVEVITQSKYVNPYTLKPMKYNKETNSIYFDCLDKTSVCGLDL